MASGIYKRTNKNLAGIRKFNSTNKGKKRPPFSDEWKKNLSLSHVGLKGTPHTDEWKKNLSIRMRGRVFSVDTKEKMSISKKIKYLGSGNPRWIEDRSLLKRDDRRNDSAYKEWRKQVFIRDGYKCRIDNDSCNRTINAHHILSWNDYIELRYEINNGITLCQAHHPKRRAEEKLLAPTFQELISQMN